MPTGASRKIAITVFSHHAGMVMGGRPMRATPCDARSLRFRFLLMPAALRLPEIKRERPG
jgi:hypothetical protein